MPCATIPRDVCRDRTPLATSRLAEQRLYTNGQRRVARLRCVATDRCSRQHPSRNNDLMRWTIAQPFGEGASRRAVARNLTLCATTLERDYQTQSRSGGVRHNGPSLANSPLAQQRLDAMDHRRVALARCVTTDRRSRPRIFGIVTRWTIAELPKRDTLVKRRQRNPLL